METVFVNSNTLFINFQICEFNTVKAGSNTETECIIAYLNTEKIFVNQFIATTLDTDKDIITAIKNNGVIHVALYVNEKNYSISKIISYKIKEELSQVNIIWYGEFVLENYSLILYNTCCDVCVLYELEKTMLKLLTSEKELWYYMENVIIRDGIISARINKDPNIHSIPVYSINRNMRLYDDKLLIAEIFLERITYEDFYGNVTRISNSFKNVIDEINNIAEEPSFAGQLVTLNAENISRVPYFDILLNLLIEKRLQLNFKINIDIEDIRKNVLDKLIRAGCNHLVITIRNQCSEEIIILLNEYKEKGWIFIELKIHFFEDTADTGFLKMILVLGLTKQQHMKISTSRVIKSPNVFPYRTMLPHNVIAVLRMRQQNERFYNFINKTYFSFITGSLNRQNKIKHTKFVSLPSELINKSTLLKLNQHVGIDSILLAKSNAMSKSEPSDIFYTENSYEIKRYDREYDSYKRSLLEAKCVINNVYQLVREDQNRICIHYNDVYLPEKRAVIERAYGSVTDEYYDGDLVLTIETDKDLEVLLENITYYASTGKFKNNYEAYVQIKDSCRWTGEEGCHLLSLTRFDIDDRNRIRTCGGCSKSIGEISNSIHHLRRNAIMLQIKAEAGRGCSRCEFNERCSKCACIPDAISPEKFCSFIKAAKDIQRYFILGDG